MRGRRWWKWALLALVVGYAAFVAWSLQSTDPYSLGRSPDIPAQIGEQVTIDDYLITVTDFAHHVTHRAVGGSTEYRSFFIKATVQCDLPQSETCRGPLRLDKIEIIEEKVELEGDELLDHGLQGGQSIDLKLSSGPSIRSTYTANEVLLIVSGPGGRLRSPHKAYFALEW